MSTFRVFYNKAEGLQATPWAVHDEERGTITYASSVRSDAETETEGQCEVPGCAKFVVKYLNCAMVFDEVTKEVYLSSKDQWG